MKNHNLRRRVGATGTCMAVCIAFVIAFSGCASAPGSSAKKDASGEGSGALHVQSPDWEDQIIYFVMTDRFFDGNTANSDQKKGEYDPSTIAKYSGGDLAGVAQKVDYIKGLGATAVWITPPVANQWWDPMVNYGGYHGYWAENLMKVDKHMGTLAEYQALSRTLHGNGMYLIQDIVPNHMGNFFRIQNIAGKDVFVKNTDSVPVSKPSQSPFNKTDFSNQAQRDAAIYHWTAGISNFDKDEDRWTGQLSDLDDLNTSNPDVVNALKKSYGYWIKAAGVDGFRIDTVKYIEHGFWNDFLWSADPANPGIMTQAKNTGRDNFIAFGECWNAAGAFSDAGDKLTASYLGTEEKPMLNGLLNFSLQSDMVDVFARGKSSDRLAWRLESLVKEYGSLTRLYNFVDNHDMDRFLASANVEDLETALLFMYTIPGVPVIYYGTEQEFQDVRASMFAAGYNSGGKDHFDTESRLYKYLASLAELRKSSKAFTRGEVTVFASTKQGAGILAYRSDSPDGKRMITVINTGSAPSLGANMESGIAGASLVPVFSHGTDASAISTAADGTFSILLPGKSAVVYEVSSDSSAAVAASAPASAVSVSGSSGIWKKDGTVTGTTGTLADARIVIDGRWDRGFPVSGSFSKNVEVKSLSNGLHHAVVAGLDETGRLIVSSPFDFEVSLDWEKALTVADALDDDLGPAGAYSYPLDPTFEDKQCDIASMDVYTAGNSVRLVFKMDSPISTAWGPLNKFDHVTFYVYFSLPGSDSKVSAMPRQNAELPDGMTWDYFAQVGGWNNWFWSSKGADAANFGSAVMATPEIKVDPEARTISFTWNAEAFDNPETISGMKIYAATYDYDGMSSANRLLSAKSEDFAFGGGDFAKDPLIMDSIGPVLIP